MIRIEELGVNIAGMVHFKQTKLESLLMNTVQYELKDVKKLTMNINMELFKEVYDV